MKEQQNSICILMKGSSLEFFSNDAELHNEIILVSDFEDELKIVKNKLKGKNITHFVNRSLNARLTSRSYKDLKIKKIQLSVKFSLKDWRLLRKYIYLKLKHPHIEVRCLPGNFNWEYLKFPEEFKNKFPNTGVLTILYAVKELKIKNIYMYGLDFYKAPYLTEQTISPNLTLEQQAGKIEKLNIIEYLINFMKDNPKTNFYIKSYYTEWPNANNIILL